MSKDRNKKRSFIHREKTISSSRIMRRQADTPAVEQVIRNALSNESETNLWIRFDYSSLVRLPHPTLTDTDARSIIECLRENPRINELDILRYDIHSNPTVLDVFRHGFLLCTFLATVSLCSVELGNDDLERLRPAFYNTSVTSLKIGGNRIQGQRGGEVLRDLLVGNNSLRELYLYDNEIGPEGVIPFGQGLAVNDCLQKLEFGRTGIGNNGLEHLVAAMDGTMNASLTNLHLDGNNIEGAEGGRQLSLLLQHLPSLRTLRLASNNLGSLGALALAPGIASACHLRLLVLYWCRLGNDGVLNLVPDGQVNRSLTQLYLDHNYHLDGENVLALVSRCINLDIIHADNLHLLPHRQRRRLDLLLQRKRLFTNALILGRSSPLMVFKKLVQANSHEHGLSASFIILRDYIFARQNHKSTSNDPMAHAATGVKRKR